MWHDDEYDEHYIRRDQVAINAAWVEAKGYGGMATYMMAIFQKHFLPW